MTMPTTSLTFLHLHLMPIVGTPTNSSLKLLTKEVYANAWAIPSTHGGSGHGHLGLVMPVAKYMVTASIAFQLLVHLGNNPIIPANVTQFQINEAVRIFKATIVELILATTVHEEMKKQLLAAIDRLYIAALDDDTFSFANISVAATLTHLCTTYGPITCAKLETNRASIATLWTPDDPIKTLWEQL